MQVSGKYRNNTHLVHRDRCHENGHVDVIHHPQSQDHGVTQVLSVENVLKASSDACFVS